MKKNKILKGALIIIGILIIFYISMNIYRYQQHVKIQNEIRSCFPSGNTCKE